MRRALTTPGLFPQTTIASATKFDALSALDAWMEKGTAPTRIVATKTDSKLSRPLCLYPQLARYNGSGDTNDAANFACAAPN